MSVCVRPKLVIILSGKRKSGKDFSASILTSMIGENYCFVLRIADPIKKHYAKENNLDFNKLLDGSSLYKERYREEMVVWGEEQREKDPGIFCRLASEQAGNDRPIWMLTDARRETDIAYFVERFGRERVLTIRITADEEVRKSRGWTFTQGIDDCTTECGLDHHEFDLVLENNASDHELREKCGEIVDIHVRELLSEGPS